MSKWRVEVSWEIDVEAEDEGDALRIASLEFSFYGHADATDLEDDRER